MAMTIHGAPLWRVALVIALLLSGLAFPRHAAAQSSPIQCAAGYALWANGQGRDETLTIPGSTISITGRVRSNADLRISGSNNRISATVEYVSNFQDGGDNNSYPAPARVSAEQPPLGYTIASYRPGGTAAVAAQAAGRYRSISGDLDVAEPTLLDGLYYVSGDAKLSASNIRGTFTIVAEGMIDVSGSSIQAAPYADGLLLLSNKREVGASVIKLAGSNSALRGAIAGPGGTVELSGSNSGIAGVILGDALELSGSDLRISFDAAACPGGPPAPPVEEPPPTERPAQIKVGDIVWRVEVINRVTLVTIQIIIRNTGGRARDSRLVLELGRDDDDDDDRRFELADVRFSEGTGYVREQAGRRVVIGLGQYNVVHRSSPVAVSVTYRLRDGVSDDDDDGAIAFALRGRVRYSDSNQGGTVVLPVLIIPVPIAIVVPVAPPAEPPRLPIDRIDVRFRATWESRGGLAIFGLPLTEARTLADGTVIQVFERARLELRSGSVQFGRLAAELGYGTPPSVGDDDLGDDDRRWYAPATGHIVAAPFRALWGRPGALPLFGLPISGLRVDADGRATQCFERVCMHVFPELRGTPNEIQLRLLGVELLAREGDDD